MNMFEQLNKIKALLKAAEELRMAVETELNFDRPEDCDTLITFHSHYQKPTFSIHPIANYDQNNSIKHDMETYTIYQHPGANLEYAKHRIELRLMDE